MEFCNYLEEESSFFADTVRGFPLAIALGDSGYYSNFELHVPLPLLANKNFFMMKKKWKEVLQIVGFLDQSWVFLKSGHDTYLWGSGVGLRFNGPYHFALSLDFGFPLNHRDLSKDTKTYLKITWQPF